MGDDIGFLISGHQGGCFKAWISFLGWVTWDYASRTAGSRGSCARSRQSSFG